MKVITSTESAEVIAIGTLKEYWDNGYPIITDINGIDCAYPTCLTVMHDVDSIPEEVEPFKHCYTEADGFYLNPNYIEPDTSNTFGVPDDVYRAIKEQAIAEVQQEVTNNANS